jgi:hypothetical protein
MTLKIILHGIHHSKKNDDRKKGPKDRTEKSRPLSQILNESLNQVSNQGLFKNGKTNILLSTNKLDFIIIKVYRKIKLLVQKRT